MPSNKKVKLNIEATSSGKGLKNTTDQIERLREGSKTASEQANALSKEVDKIEEESGETQRELRNMVDELDSIALGAAKAAYESEKLVREMDDLSEASETTSRRSDRVNRSIKKSPEGTRAAAKGKRDLGEASLYASEGLRNMESGVSSILDSLPSLITSIGGSAGLAGVTSILAVSAAALIPLLTAQGNAIKLNAQIAEEAADKRVAAAARERRATRENAEELDSYQVVLEEEVNQVSRNLQAITDLSAARSRAHAHQQAIREAELGLEIAVIQNDDSLSDLDKILAIESAKKQKSLNDQAAAEEDLQQRVKSERSKAAKSEEDFSKIASDNLIKRLQLERQITAEQTARDKLSESIEAAEKSISEVSIPALDKIVNAEAGANFAKAIINPLGNNGTLFAPDREDFETDEAFVSKVSDLSNPVLSPEGKGLTKTRAAVDAIKSQNETLEASRVALELSEANIKLLEEQEQTLKSVEDAARKKRNTEIEAAEKNIELLEEQKKNTLELNEINNASLGVESQSKIKRSAETSVTREVSELGKTFEDDLNQQQSTLEELAQAREQYKRIEQLNRKALEDGVIDASEQQAISTALGDFRRLFTAQSQATITNISQLMEAVRAQQQVSSDQSQAIKTLQQSVQSR